MTSDEFNEKYKQWLVEGHYGLAISSASVIEMLDREFQELTKVPEFQYYQIKLKFNMARFYAKGIPLSACDRIEKQIDALVKAADDERKIDKGIIGRN